MNKPFFHNGLQGEQTRFNQVGPSQQEIAIAHFEQGTSFSAPLIAKHPGLLEQPRLSEGLISAFKKICDRWKLTDAEMFSLLGYKHDADVFLWTQSLEYLPRTTDVTDRVGYVAAISFGLGTLFADNREKELAWLQRPNWRLENKVPLDHMLDGHMVSLINVSNVVLDERGL
jgi:hypothetical protein